MTVVQDKLTLPGGAPRAGVLVKCRLIVPGWDTAAQKQIDGIAPEFRGKGQRDPNQRRMRRCPPDFEVGPATGQTLNCGLPGDEERVTICLIDLSESFDQVGGVTFVAA